MKSAQNKLYNLGFDKYLTRKYHDYCLLSQYYRKSNNFDNIENIIAILDALLILILNILFHEITSKIITIL